MVRHNYGVSSMKISKQVPKENTTPVVFRVWNACPCDIIALFPALAADNQGYYCESYQHVGQHGPADYKGCIKTTRPATKKEAAPLLAELRRIGYGDLQVVERATPAMAIRRSWGNLVI